MPPQPQPSRQSLAQHGAKNGGASNGAARQPVQVRLPRARDIAPLVRSAAASMGWIKSARRWRGMNYVGGGRRGRGRRQRCARERLQRDSTHNCYLGCAVCHWRGVQEYDIPPPAPRTCEAGGRTAFPSFYLWQSQPQVYKSTFFFSSFFSHPQIMPSINHDDHMKYINWLHQGYT